NELWVNEVGVGDHYRGQGMAPALLEALFAWARTHECENVWLLMDEGNIPAERSYRKLSPSSERRDTVMFEWSLKPAADE
ncbi:MAG: GNAT family N-acetyltransferase, partial [Pseudomonadales bacterium]